MKSNYFSSEKTKKEPEISVRKQNLYSRRQILKITGVLATTTFMPGSVSTLTKADSLNGSTSGIQPGIFLSVFSPLTLEAQLDAVKNLGLSHIQLSMSAVGLPLMPDHIPQASLERIRQETSARQITIAALQGTFNMAHPDAEQRQAGLQSLSVLVEAANTMGVNIIHICTGTRNRGSIWSGHPDNNTSEAWHDMFDCIQRAVKIAEQAKVTLAFEPEVHNIVDSPEKARRLMDDIGSAYLKVAIDGANLFHRGDLARQAEVLDHAFELIGHDVVSAHAKDLDHDGDAGDLPAGHGKLDYDRYLRLLAKYGFNGAILLHSLNESQAPRCVQFLQEKLSNLADKVNA